MKTILLIASLALISHVHADTRAEVHLSENSMGMVGADDRPKVALIEFTRGIMVKKPIEADERIATLEKYLAYYKQMKKHGIDPLGEVDGKYRETPLIEALNEIFPEVPVIFEEGVDKKVKIRKLMLDKVPREKVFTYIGHSAGVYIGCSEKGIHIQAAP